MKGTVTAAVFVEFLTLKLCKAINTVFLIVHGHPMHCSKAVSMFIATTEGMLQLVFSQDILRSSILMNRYGTI